MLGSHFYNQIVRKNIIAFGTLFNNITLKSTDPSTGAVLEELKVPLAYGPKQKFVVRLEENASSRKVAITLPRLYFEMTSIDYDPTRKTSPIQKYKTIINGNQEFVIDIEEFENFDGETSESVKIRININGDDIELNTEEE